MNRHSPLRGRKATLLSAILAGACVVALMPQMASAMSLKEAISLVIQTNPDINGAMRDRRATDYELRQGRGLYYPQIDFHAQSGPEWTESSTVDAGDPALDQKPHDNGFGLLRADADITLQQRIFDGFDASNEVDRQKARVASAANVVQDKSQIQSLSAVDSYLGVLKNQARVENALANVKAHEDTLALVQKRADLGGGNVADVRQAEARLATARTQLKTIQGDLRAAQISFQRVVGQVPTDLEPVTFTYDSLVPEDVEKSVAHAIEVSPKVQGAKYDVVAAEHLLGRQEAAMYPTLNLNATAAVNRYDNGIKQVGHSANALLVLDYNIYRGGADLARIREFKWRKQEAIDAVRNQERVVAEDVRNSWSQRQTKRESVETLTEEYDKNVQTEKLYEQQFDIGQRSLLDLLNARNEVFQSQDNLIAAQSDEVFANFKILAAQGELVQAVGISLPKEATPKEVEYDSN
jgi:adhesin transport system outer membrane protein